VQKNKGTKKIIAKLTLSNSEPVNFRVNLKITGSIEHSSVCGHSDKT
jgi:hypothetical protein